MEQKAPDWLDINILTECLRHEEGNENLKVTSFTTTPAAPAASNIGSVVLRITLRYVKDNKEGRKSLIMKTQHYEGPMFDMLDGIEFQEPFFYYEFISEIRKLISEPYVPRSLYSPRPFTVFLEDLDERGFKSVDRRKLLDFDHCRLYMIAAATLHSASLVVFKHQPKFIELLETGHILSIESKMAPSMKNMMIDSIKAMVNAVEKTESLKKYWDVFTNVSENIWDILTNAYKPNKDWNTILQGDPWLTNMMFKYDDTGNVSDIRILDFQSPRIGNPLTDLMVFLWSSSNSDVKRNKLHNLYKVYTDTFNARLEEMNYPDRLPEGFVVEGMKKLSPVAVQVTALGVAMANPSVAFDPQEVVAAEEDEKKGIKRKNTYEKYYDVEFCKGYLTSLLEDMESAGIFEKYKPLKN